MLKITTQLYSKKLLRKTPDQFYVFGDNAKRYGKAGQACIRGERNAIGVATKWSPGTHRDDYFYDIDADACVAVIKTDIAKLQYWLNERYIVWLPAAGLGTGLSQLPERAPQVYAYMCHTLRGLWSKYGDVDTPHTQTRIYKDIHI